MTDTAVTLREKRDQLYQEAAAGPGSEAYEMVQTLLLAGVAGLEPGWNQESDRELAEERREFAARARLAPEVQSRIAGTGDERLRHQVWESAACLSAAARRAGQNLTADEVYQAIFEAVGIRERRPEQAPAAQSGPAPQEPPAPWQGPSTP